MIEQAKGKLVGQRDLSMDDAFDAIRRHARSNQVTVRSIAEAIVERDLDIPDPPR